MLRIIVAEIILFLISPNGNFGGMENMFGGGISGKLAKMSVNRMIKKNKKKKRKQEYDEYDYWQDNQGF